MRTGTLTGSAPSKPPTTPDKASKAFPRELQLGGATLRLTSDRRLKVSGVRIPDPHENAFVPDARDGSIWIEALLAWCQSTKGSRQAGGMRMTAWQRMRSRPPRRSCRGG